MKKFALDLMENIDEKFITEANEKPRSRKTFIISAVAACACIALVLSVTLKGKTEIPEIPDEPMIENTQISKNPDESPAVIAEEPESVKNAQPKPLSINTHPTTGLGGTPAVEPAGIGNKRALSELVPGGIGAGPGMFNRFADTFESTRSNLFEGALSESDALPVYMAKYSSRDIAEGKVVYTDEDMQKTLTDLISLVEKAGYSSEEVTPDTIGGAFIQIGNTTIRSHFSAYSVQIDSVDISDPDWLNDLIDTDPIIKTMMEMYGITDPYVEIHTDYPYFFYDFENLKDEYSVEANYCNRTIYVSQNADTLCKFLTSSALYTMTVSYTEYTGENTADVFLFFDKPAAYVHAGDFKVLSYDEALAEFCKITDKTADDIVACELSYRFKESPDYVIPCYAFYSLSNDQYEEVPVGNSYDCTIVRAVIDS